MSLPDLKPEKSRQRMSVLAWTAILVLLTSAIAAPGSESLKYIYLPLVVRLLLPSTGTPGVGGVLISEVLYNPAGTEPEEEWIEIFNSGVIPVDLSAYKVGDEETPGGQEGMLQFPAHTIIAPGQVLVIAYHATSFRACYGRSPDFEMRESDPLVLDMIKYTAWAGGPVELVNSGDEVFLLNGTDLRVDALSWGDSTQAFTPSVAKVSEGHSIERSPAYKDTDSAGDWIDQALPNPGGVDTSTPTPTATEIPTTAATPTPEGPLVLLLSEVYYDPPGTAEPAGEWVEVFNAGKAPLNLAGYKLGDEETPGQGEGMYQFPAAAGLQPGGLVIVANQAAAFRAIYGFNPDYEISNSDAAVPDMIRYRDWAGGSMNLSNSGDEVLILDANDQVADALSWGSSNWAFDPPLRAIAEGHSLERKPAQIDTNRAEDWVDQPLPDPGEIDLSLPASTPTPENTNTPLPAQTPTHTPSVTPPLPPATHLLVSELFYDTPGTDSDEEWIEIFNPTLRTFDLSAYKIGDEETAGGSEGMFRFPENSSIGPGQKVVLALKATGFRALYDANPDFEIVDSDPSVPDMLKYADWASGAVFALANTGDEVILLDEKDLAVDVAAYEAGSYEGVVPHPGVSTGHSLERSPAGQDTGDCSLDFVDRDEPSPGW